ncbi:hypothetical protein BXZ70DRAFT_1010695 [Cristinia sonorae]|uniref:NADAR domain-containing protein n=1 Tax=Cristinia sonorae TaxID=1940300 RepID=A0A8K0UIS4_9AGAR|nr:hypothetical protein BXZ70DRAFT_1010695 [Cristinia sonorae]
MASAITHSQSDSTVFRGYTPDQWSRRIQDLQSRIYGPPVSQSPPPLNISTDFSSQPFYPDTRPNSSHVPQVINTASYDSRASSRSATSSYPVSARSAYRDDPERRSTTPSHSSVSIDDIRPLHRERFNNSTSPPVHSRYEGGEDEFIEMGRDGSRRTRGIRHRNDEDYRPPSFTPGGSAGTRSRRVSEYGQPNDFGARTPATPLRSSLRRRPSRKEAFPEPEYGEDEGFHEGDHYSETRSDRMSNNLDGRRQPYSAITPVNPHGTPYPTRPRHLSDAPRLDERQGPVIPPPQVDTMGSRPPSGGPVIPGVTVPSAAQREARGSRPPTMYGAPMFEPQARSVDYRDPSARVLSRPTSTLDHQPFPLQPPTPAQPSRSSRRASAANSPVYPPTRREQQFILFYNKGEPYYGFTNFSPHPVIYNGKKYPTSEHLFQSFKFHEFRPELAEHIRTCSQYPSSALAEARRLQDEVRPDWFNVNISKMYETLRLKFSQHLDLRAELLGTGDAILVEASEKDAFWGYGPDRRGRNELGKALMKLREELRALT